MPAYKDKIRNSWFAKFNFKDWQGNTKQKIKRGFTKKSDALAFEHEFKAKYSAMPSISLQTLATAFLDDYSINHRENTFISAERNLRLYILPYFPKMPIESITPLIIRKWQRIIIERGLAKSSMHAIQTTFKSLMKFAVKYYNLPKSPLDNADTLGEISTRPTFIELGEWKRIDEVIEKKHDKAFYNLLFWSGIRIGECRGLTPQDFDFDKNEISINKQLSGTKVIPPKTKGSYRTVSMPQFVMNTVKDYFDSLIECPEYPFAVLSVPTQSKRLKAYCKKAGIKDINIHALRHSHASLLIRLNVPITVISKRLGHSSPTMTLRIYSHAYNDDMQNVGTMLENLK